MRQYELTYLVSDKVSDADMNAATGKINALINAHKGKVLGEENWGRRKLAYPINKQEFATYVTLNFELDPLELVKINRELRLSKEIVRSLIILKDFKKEKMTLSADEVTEAGEITEVVGGERSFEAVEGETEESYDLMAKREDTTEEAEEPKKVSPREDTAENTEETDETEAESSEEAVAKKKTVAKTKKDKKDEEAEVAKKPASAAKEEKPKKKAAAKKAEKPAKESAKEEADRLAKLDEEIEGILGDDL